MVLIALKRHAFYGASFEGLSVVAPRKK